MAGAWARPCWADCWPSGRVTVDEVAVVEVSADRRDHLAKRFPGIRVVAEPVAADGVIVATKPADVVEALRAAVGGRRGPGAVDRRRRADRDARDALPAATCAVVRAMPNTPALVGAGAAAICGGRAAPRRPTWPGPRRSSPRSGTWSGSPSRLLDAVTGLSGSGPAYVFLDRRGPDRRRSAERPAPRHRRRPRPPDPVRRGRAAGRAPPTAPSASRRGHLTRPGRPRRASASSRTARCAPRSSTPSPPRPSGPPSWDRLTPWALRYSTVTFLSDYGRTDEFVGVVHSVIRGRAPPTCG